MQIEPSSACHSGVTARWIGRSADDGYPTREAPILKWARCTRMFFPHRPRSGRSTSPFFQRSRLRRNTVASLFLLAALCVASPFSSGSALAAAPKPPTTKEETVRVTPEIRNLIKGGLKYLASKQRIDGSWSLNEGRSGHPVAITGYALLAFMAAGNLPHEGEYAKNVAAGMQFLLDSAQPDGLYRGVSGGQYMYNHGIATIALAELYGESHSPALRIKLQRAVDIILRAQSDTGGWRYTPEPRDADISVTVAQAVALRAAQDAGLSIPQGAITRAIDYVNSCYSEDKGGFSYQPKGGPGFARTAAAIYSLQVLGKYDDPHVKAGSEFLVNSKDHSYWSYGNYYAAPAQYMVGGDTWRSWYAELSENLITNAHHEGDMVFWDRTVDPSSQGPVFTTAVCVHILAMPYHLIPLYQR